MGKARTKHAVGFLQQTACFYHKFLMFGSKDIYSSLKQERTLTYQIAIIVLVGF